MLVRVNEGFEEIFMRIHYPKMHKFRIKYFDELDDLSQLTTLYYLCLNSTRIAPEFLNKMRQNEDRSVPEFGMFAVNPDGIVIGGVFLMKILTKTINGDITVGGLSGVATRPGYERKGVMTTLATRCHDYFARDNIDYIFLTTTRSSGAYSLYRKLGYKDLAIHKIAWKQARGGYAHDKDHAIVNFENQNNSDVDRIFSEATEGSYGFVYRPKKFLKARMFGPFPEPSPLEKMRLARLNEEISGYAYWEPSSQVCTCTEILANDKSSFISLLIDAENRFENRTLIINCGGLSKQEIGWLQTLGYHTGIPTYWTVMVKSTGNQTKLETTKSLFGVNIELFRMGIWDST